MNNKKWHKISGILNWKSFFKKIIGNMHDLKTMTNFSGYASIPNKIYKGICVSSVHSRLQQTKTRA